MRPPRPAVNNARRLRKTLSLPEGLLWRILRLAILMDHASGDSIPKAHTSWISTAMKPSSASRSTDRLTALAIDRGGTTSGMPTWRLEAFEP
jgi:hypothetical protein